MVYPILLHIPTYNSECIIEFTSPDCGTIIQEIPRSRDEYIGTSERVGYYSDKWATSAFKPPPIQMLRDCTYAVKNYPELFI